MSVAAVMLVKDEADVIVSTIVHLLHHVDHVLIADNGSTDGTRDLLADLKDGTVTVTDDREPGYYQSAKTTALAMVALEAGHQWVVPCDADECWYAPDGRMLRDWFAGVAPDVMVVTSQLYNHVPTEDDRRKTLDPLRRITWRQREPQTLGKVAARLRPDLSIEMGNHGARTTGTGLTVPGLHLRHFPWRSPEQYLRKIRNGSAAYAASNLPATFGVHWRMFDGKPDEAVLDHYEQWFHSSDPGRDDTLVHDPAPVQPL